MTVLTRWPEAVRHAHLHECLPSERKMTETLIKERFRQSFGADLHALMPRLFTLNSDVGELLCAFGLREAAQHQLYMEQYLDQPVEAAISDLAGRSVERARVIEVGNLAAMPGNARTMIVTVTRYLHDAGYHWVVFTGVASLRAAFTRLGLKPQILAKADPARLTPDDLAKWGNYFASLPQVMAGDIRNGYRMLSLSDEGSHISWQSAS